MNNHPYELIAFLSILCGLMIFVLIICGVLLVKSKAERKRLKNELVESWELRGKQLERIEKLKSENKELYKTLASKD